MDNLTSQLTFSCSMSAIETLQTGAKYVCLYMINFEHVSHIFLVFVLLTLNKQMLVGIITGNFVHPNSTNVNT